MSKTAASSPPPSVTKKFDAWWFAHFDFHGFFPSTTPGFVLSQFELIYPFNLILASPTGHAELLKALDLCFLNRALPQGTPISPAHHQHYDDPL